MKNKIFIITASVLGALLLLYFAFLFIVPNVINVNKFLPDVCKTVKDTTTLNLEIKNPKIITGWNFSAGVKADEIIVKYKDEKEALKLQKPIVSVQIFPLIFKTVKFNKINAENFVANLYYTKDGKYTFEEIITHLEKSSQTQPQETQAKEESEPVEFKLKNANLIVAKMALNVKDEKSKQNATLSANDTKIKLSSLQGPLQITTAGNLEIDGEKFITHKINLKTVFPKINQEEAMNEPKQNEPLKLFNPFENVAKYNLKANVDVDLDIKSLDNFKANGYANIDKFSFLSNGKQLPESYLHTTFQGEKITVDSKFYTNIQDNLALQSEITPAKNIILTAKTDHISLNDVKNLIYTALVAFGIKNDINTASVGGYLTSDFKLQSNFKELNSNGLLSVKNASVIYPKLKLKITEILSDIDFSNNTITIKNTGAKINGAKINIYGNIARDSQTDITVKSDPLRISDLVNTALSMRLLTNEMIKDYEFKNGTITLDVNAKGKFDNILPQAIINIKDFAMRIKSANIPINIKFIDIDAKTVKNEPDISIKVSNTTASMTNPKLNISIPLMEIFADAKDLQIKKTTVNAGNSKFEFQGKVKNYPKSDMNLDITAQGTVNPLDVIAQVPKNSRSLITYKGQMPVEAKVSGTLDAIKLIASLTSDPQNYVSIFEVTNLTGKTNKLAADIALKGSNLLINDVSITSDGSKAATVNGQLSSINTKTPLINDVKVSVPNTLNLKIPAMQNAKLSATGNLNISGSVAKPVLTGDFKLSDIAFPQYKATVKSASAVFDKSKITASVKGADIDGSDFEGELVMSSDFSKSIDINSLTFHSAYIDADKLMKLASDLTPKSSASASSSSTSSQANAPEIILNNGVAQIDKLKFGNLIVTAIKSNFTLLNNLFKLSDLQAQTCKGNLTGDVTYNLLTTLATVDANAKTLDAAELMKSLMGSKLAMSGTLDAEVDVSLKGTTQNEQMQTLKGNVEATIQNGDLGEVGSLEHFLGADNLTDGTIKQSVDSVTSTVSSKDTSKFKHLKAKLSFANGYANINSLETSGAQMSLFANGKYNLLSSSADIKVLGRLSNEMSALLGPISNLSLTSVTDKLSSGALLGLAIVQDVLASTAKVELFATESQATIDKIPALSSGTQENSKLFRVQIQGTVNNPRAVKSFRWVDVVK